MPIKVQKDLPARAVLEEENIFISKKQSHEKILQKFEKDKIGF